MAAVSVALSKYIRDVIRIPQADISDTARSRKWFLTRIANEIDARVGEPVLYEPRSFVHFGSYFKQTKVQSVDEYDVLVVIDSNRGVYSSGETPIGDGLGSADPNPKYHTRYRKSDGSGVSPAKMLNWLKDVTEAVVDSYGGEAPIRNGQAITAHIKSQDVDIDLVPAGIFRRRSDGEEFYNIPKGDQAGGWIETMPRADIDRLASVAGGREDFRNVVRIAKRIRSTYRLTVSSFAVETAVVEYAEQHEWPDSLAFRLYGALVYLEARFRAGWITDAADGGNLIEGVASLSSYAERLEKIVVRLMACAHYEHQEDADDEVYAILENE